GEAPLTGRSCVRHNGDGEKNGDANQVERDVSEVTEG
ncbi:putative transposase, partial [Escherichia coli P02997067.6]